MKRKKVSEIILLVVIIIWFCFSAFKIVFLTGQINKVAFLKTNILIFLKKIRALAYSFDPEAVWELEQRFLNGKKVEIKRREQLT